MPDKSDGTAIFDFTDRVVIVTGASRGIGAEIASKFALAGARVVLHGRDQQALQEQAAHVESLGAQVVTARGNLRDPDVADAVVRTALDAFGRIDILINNAGGTFASRLCELSPNGWSALVETNLHSVFFASRACYPTFEAQGSGLIVNIGSVASEGAHPSRAPYAAAKAGVVALTRTMAWEWAAAGIRVNCVAPGAIGTSASRFADDQVEAATTRHIPLRRLGQPTDVANACLFLCTTAASFITGTTLRVDGGPSPALAADGLGTSEHAEARIS